VTRLSVIQDETWAACVAHFETLAVDVVRESIDDAHVRQHVLALMGRRFREARRSCIDEKPAESRKLHGRDFGGAA
jgi:hypothetical protein